MQVQINTDHNIEGHEAVAKHVDAVVQHALGKWSEHITRVEVHLSDEKNSKSEFHDKRCMMEARLHGRGPLSVSEHATTLHQAIDGAADKLVRMVDSTLKRLHDHKLQGREPVISESPTPEE